MTQPLAMDRVEGSVRPLLEDERVRVGKREGWLVDDPQRRRTRYFDGLLLKAADFVRDQDYFSSRQADLSRLGGAGVVQGLFVARGATSASLSISAGHGVNAAGALLVLGEALSLDLSDAARAQAFDAIFALETRPETPARNRSGLFVLALRPLEFTANPAATYPESLQGQRVLHDGDIIEAVAVTLIPLEEITLGEVRQHGRARAAREIFVRRGLERLGPDVLPLAVVALERAEVVWVDHYLVRRDKAVDDGLGRALREAFVRQYLEHLEVILAERGAAPLRPFAAVDHFQALPPFGALPADALRVDGDELVQSFFPPQLGVELALVPGDELAALADDALSLAPIDLTASTEALEDVQVLVLLPVPRAELSELASELEGKLSRSPRPHVTRPIARLPAMALLGELRRRHREPATLPVPADLLPWQTRLDALRDAGAPLYYARRRRFTEPAFAASRFQALPPDSPEPSETLSDLVRQRLIAAGELDPAGVEPRTTHALDFLLRATDGSVLRAVEALLGMPAFVTLRQVAGSDVDLSLMTNAVVEELAHRTRVRLDDLVVSEAARASVIATDNGILAPVGSAPQRVRALTLEDVSRTRGRYADPARGDGLAELIRLEPSLATAAVRELIARSLRVPELDGTVASLATEAERRSFAEQLLSNAGLEPSRAIVAIRDMVDARFGPVTAGPDEEQVEPIAGFPGSEVAVMLGEGRLYHLLHAAADDTIKARLSDTLLRPSFNLRFIVSSFLTHLLYEGWDLRVGSALEARNVLEALHAWSPGEVYGPDEARGDGRALNEAGDAANVFTFYEQLSTLTADGFQAALPELLAGLGNEPNDLRMFGLSGTSGPRPVGAAVIVRLFQLRADAAAQGRLIDNLRAAAVTREPSAVQAALAGAV